MTQIQTGSTSRNTSPARRSSEAITLAEKSIEADRPCAEMIFSRPENAPHHACRTFIYFML
jgi:hypothetical protein